MQTDKCLPPAEKRCKATGADVPRSRIASSADRMASRRTLAATHRESTESKSLYRCCAQREA